MRNLISMSLLFGAVVLLPQYSHSKFNGDGLKNTAVGIGATVGVAVAVNYATGNKLAGICSGGVGAWACPLAAMSFVQAFTSAKKGGDMADFSGEVGYDPNNFDFSGGIGSMDSTMGGGTLGGAGGVESQLAQRIQELKDKGYSVDPDTGQVKMPDGSSYSADQFASPSSMAAAGIIDENQVSDISKKLKVVQEDVYKVVKAKFGTAGGTGGFGGGSRGIASANYESGMGDMSGLLGLLNKKKKVKVVKTSGLIKNLNGTPVGVTTDNIFKMINRRYQTHSKKNSFKE